MGMYPGISHLKIIKLNTGNKIIRGNNNKNNNNNNNNSINNNKLVFLGNLLLLSAMILSAGIQTDLT